VNIPCGRFAVGESGWSGQVLAHSSDQHRHLVGDDSDVCLPGAEHRQAGALPGRHDEQERGLHLDDGLPDRPALELTPGAAGQALDAGRQGREMLAVLTAQILRCRHDQAVPGQDQGLADRLDARDEIVQ